MIATGRESGASPRMILPMSLLDPVKPAKNPQSVTFPQPARGRNRCFARKSVEIILDPG
jgi:hypothetical protein